MTAVNLDQRRAQKFLRHLAEDPFLCLVVVDGELRIYAKGMSEKQLAEVKSHLIELEGEDADGEDQG